MIHELLSNLKIAPITVSGKERSESHVTYYWIFDDCSRLELIIWHNLIADLFIFDPRGDQIAHILSFAKRIH